MEHLADLVVLLHLLYAAFLVLGCACIVVGARRGWRWIRSRRFRITHLVLTLIVPLEALIGAVCPLTELERTLRDRAGQPIEDLSFIARLVRAVLFVRVPEWVLGALHLAFGVLVLVLFFRIPPRPRGSSSPQR